MTSLKLFFGFLAAACAASAQQYVISTFAGIPNVSGYYGDGGPATSGEFVYPWRIALDSKGNLYVSDLQTFVIRQISGGNIFTLAGDGVLGYSGDGGPAIQASINDVHGIGTDAAGNVYLADTGSSVIRRVDPNDVISTFAGNNILGYNGDGGPATKAQLGRPAGVVADASGNVYIADYGNLTVRKISTSLVISTIAGTGIFGYTGDGGPANKATFGAPAAIALDKAGNIYVSDISFNNIRKITGDGNIQTIASNVTANAIAVDSAGNVYFPDMATDTIRKLLPSGTIQTIAGNGTPGFSGDGSIATFAQLNQPQGIAVDASGNVYVADTGNNIIRLLTPTSPAFSVAAVVNGASGLVGPIAPGEIVTIYGAGLGPATGVSNTPVNGVYGTQVGGTSVYFDGVNAPILYASATQVSAIVPYEEQPFNTAGITVVANGQTAQTVSVPVLYTAPGLFTLNASGSGQAAAINYPPGVNGSSNPVPVGGFISLYATGEGQTNPNGVDGKLASSTPPTPQQSVIATVGGIPAVVTYAGGAPGEVAGVMQVNLQIPPGVTPGSAVPVTIQVGTVQSQSGVTIAVSAN